MKDTHEKTQYKMHRACLLDSDEKYHSITDTNSTRTAVSCRHNMTEINRDIRTTDRSHANQENVGSSGGLSGRCGVDSGPGVALRRTIAAPAPFSECLP
jgi:hypothetical protein